MKRLLKLAGFTAIVFAINVTMLVGVIGLIAVNAGPTPSGNGDVNGDGSINLADAVYLLTHVFEGGPAPVAIAQAPTCESCWPPRPENIVNLDSANHPDALGQSVTIDALDFAVLFTAPLDHAVVLTDIHLLTNTYDLVAFDGADERVLVNVSFRPNGSNNKIGAMSTGIAILPGEELRIRSRLGGSSAFQWHVTGYLAQMTP